MQLLYRIQCKQQMNRQRPSKALLFFLNPISLLAALQKLSLRDVENAQDESTCDFLTVADIQRQYGLSEDYVHSALLAGSISPSKMILYFSKSDVEELVSNKAEALEANPLTVAFEKELDKMVMNYSYKPLLLLALFSKESLSAEVEEIIDFYGELLEIHLEKQHERNRGSVSFVFDIADWKVSSSRYLSKERPAGFDQSRIKLTFQNCRDIKIVDPFRDLGEIKFGNSSDRKLMRQDEFPGLAPELERPFCVFYARSGESIIIDFDEETCIISAELC